jgi:hypothetical protein
MERVNEWGVRGVGVGKKKSNKKKYTEKDKTCTDFLRIEHIQL